MTHSDINPQDLILEVNEETKKLIKEELKKHHTLKAKVVDLVKSLLEQDSLHYLDVSGRVKDEKSALEKIKRKKYKNPLLQLTDLTGIRITTCFEEDVVKIIALIRKSLAVDKKNSKDQEALLKDLGEDRVGYRSVHLVCTLGAKRRNLPEYTNLTKLKFEIQIRTVLQHAWAELAHDRIYKIPEELPLELKRRVSLAAGHLEIADQMLSSLIKDIEKKRDEIAKDDLSALLSQEINSLNFPIFLEKYFKSVGASFAEEQISQTSNYCLHCLKQKGIKTLSEVKSIFDKLDLKEKNLKPRRGFEHAIFVLSMNMNDIVYIKMMKTILAVSAERGDQLWYEILAETLKFLTGSEKEHFTKLYEENGFLSPPE